mmetsp:Transcript_4459/g.12858  ORF Transcript_4459/g.12858 Transcript_4459/m.12858 type:complete len:253 (-) Transcript_4459:1304-2062(-)
MHCAANRRVRSLGVDIAAIRSEASRPVRRESDFRMEAPAGGGGGAAVAGAAPPSSSHPSSSWSPLASSPCSAVEEAAGPEASTMAEQAASHRDGCFAALACSSVHRVARIWAAMALTFSASSALNRGASTCCQLSASGSLSARWRSVSAAARRSAGWRLLSVASSGVTWEAPFTVCGANSASICAYSTVSISAATSSCAGCTPRASPSRCCISRMIARHWLYGGLPFRSSGPSAAIMPLASRPTAGRMPNRA